MKISNRGSDYSIELKINNYEINAIEFDYIKIKEKLHNDLPECEISLFVTQEALPNFVEIGSKIEFTWKDGNFNDKWDFYQTSFEYTQDKKRFHLLIRGIVYAPDYFQNSFKQESFKDKTTAELFGTISSVKPKVRIPGLTNDKQTWIRPNYTDKSWIDYLYNFSYISQDDLVLCALNFKNELIIDNLKNIKTQKPKLISNYDKKADFIYNNYTFERRISILDYKLSPLRKVKTFEIPTHLIKELDLPTGSIFTGKSYNKLKPYYPFKTLLDNMNTYPEYLFAYRFNQVMRNRIHFFQLKIDLDSTIYRDINLLDYIEFKELDANSMKPVELTAGYYIVSERELVFTKQKIESQKIILSRDYFL
jgi:hypothetical protein